MDKHFHRQNVLASRLNVSYVGQSFGLVTDLFHSEAMLRGRTARPMCRASITVVNSIETSWRAVSHFKHSARVTVVLPTVTV